MPPASTPIKMHDDALVPLVPTSGSSSRAPPSPFSRPLHQYDVVDDNTHAEARPALADRDDEDERWEQMPQLLTAPVPSPYRWPAVAALLCFVGLVFYQSSVGVSSTSMRGEVSQPPQVASLSAEKARFLVPVMVAEQESRAQHHLVQLSRLAATLNRTLVLPNFTTSRFRTCGSTSFADIYDPASFAQYTAPPEAAEPVLQRDFERWLAEGPERRTARAIRLSIAASPEELAGKLGVFYPDGPIPSGRATCLDYARLDFGDRDRLVAVEEWHPATDALVRSLERLNAEDDDVEVLLVDWDLRGPFLGVEGDEILVEAFQYAQPWHTLAAAVAGTLGEAVGVHWRTETVQARSLGPCGEGLVEALVGLKERHRALESVYLALDYPLELLDGAPSRVVDARRPALEVEEEEDGEGAGDGDLEKRQRAHSDTFSKSLTPTHHAAMSRFLASYASQAAPAGLALNTYRSVLPSLLPSLAKPLARLAKAPFAPAIVSQLVLQRTALFLAGEARRVDEGRDPSREMPPYDAGPDTPPWRWPAVAALLFLFVLFVWAHGTEQVFHEPAMDTAGVVVLSVEQVCGGELGGCRLLVPTIIGEQESRAQHHLIQLSRLASTLNRTLVLPNFATSRFMTCGSASFDSIYDPGPFVRASGAARAVLQGSFELWLADEDAHALPHSARAVRLRVLGAPEPLESTHGALVRDEALGGQSRAALCLDERRLDFGQRKPLVAVVGQDDEAGGELLENLRRLDVEDEVEVLLVHWDLREPLLGTESDELLEASFVYADAWHALAAAVVDELGKAVGVHWRTEGIAATSLDECGEGLVEALVGLKEGDGALRSVYLASDFPLERLPEAPSHAAAIDDADTSADAHEPPLVERPSLAHSDTLSDQLTPAHDAALSHFLSSFASRAAPAGLVLSTYRSLLPVLLSSLPAPLAALAQSPAAPAIVSQLVLQRTARFVAGESRLPHERGARDKCARRSSWTKRVVVARERAREGLEKGDEGAVVGWWSTDGRLEY
ncbi:hypothetical protein JCM9279_003038 [Rhodotorula babjevae]